MKYNNIERAKELIRSIELLNNKIAEHKPDEIKTIDVSFGGRHLTLYNNCDNTDPICQYMSNQLDEKIIEFNKELSELKAELETL